MSTAAKLIEKSAKLYTLPDVYLRLKSLLDGENYSHADVAAIVSQDPGLTARLLRMVNSAFFGLASKVETVSQAVSLLGTRQIHDLALSTCVTQAFSGIPPDVIDMESFWRDSVRCGATSRLLAYLCNVLESERLFVAGLLRNIGHLVMLHQIPEQTREALHAAGNSPYRLHLLERKIIGFDYAEVGAALVEAWEFPLSLYEILAFHNSPKKASHYPMEVSIVHIAHLLCTTPESDDWLTQVERDIDPEALSVTGIVTEKLAAVRSEAVKKTEQALDLIFPSTRKAS